MTQHLGVNFYKIQKGFERHKLRFKVSGTEKSLPCFGIYCVKAEYYSHLFFLNEFNRFN